MEGNSSITSLMKAVHTWKHEQHTSSAAFGWGLGQTSEIFQQQYLEQNEQSDSHLMSCESDSKRTSLSGSEANM